MQLHEQYRPATWDEVVGQDKAIRKVEAVKKRGLGGRAFWVSGKSGVGKTTIARLLAREVADSICIEEIDATDLSADKLREIDDTMHLYGFGQGGRAYIVNEAHGLRGHLIRRLLVLLENLPSHVVWVFTTTCDGQTKLFDGQIDAHPLLSRCTQIDLASDGLLTVFAERLKYVAEQEGLNGKPMKSYRALVKRCRLNLREAYQAVEAGEMML